MNKFIKKYNKEMFMTIIALAWPTMLEQFMQTAVQYIDTAMVGALGTQATASVGATSTANWLVGGTVFALSIGFLSFIARACGAGEKETAKHVSAQAFMVTLFVGTLFTIIVCALSPYVPVWMQVDPAIQSLAATYFFIINAPLLFRSALIILGTVLRAAGDTKTPMKIGIMVNIINIILNFILIYPTRDMTLLGFSFTLFGMNLGVIGAALASAISFSIGGIYITYVVWKHPLVSFKGQSLKPDMKILKPCLVIALPTMLQRFGTSLGFVVFASMINSLGEVATAAHTIANTVESAFYIPGYGMQSAAATLAGNAYGAYDNKKMNELAHMFIPIEIGLMIVSGALLFIFAPSLMSIFSNNSSVIDLGTTVLRMVALSEPFYGFSIIIEGFMQGVGKTKQPFIFNIAGMWCVRIVGTFICTQILHYGLVSAWMCMIMHNLLIFILFMICFIKGTWNHLNIKKA